MLSQPALSQTSKQIQEVPVTKEENKSPNGSEFSFSENIPTSKLKDSPRSVSSFAMPVMMTYATSLEGISLDYSSDFRRINKVYERMGSIERSKIALLMDKIGNTSRLNCEDESSKPKQTHNDKPKSPTKDLKLSADGSISSDQHKELIKEAIKDQVGVEVNHPLPMPSHTLKG